MDNQQLTASMVGRSVLTTLPRLRFFLSPLFVVMLLTIPGCSGGSQESGKNPEQVTLKLGGDDCEFYLGAVEAALKKLQGVHGEPVLVFGDSCPGGLTAGTPVGSRSV